MRKRIETMLDRFNESSAHLGMAFAFGLIAMFGWTERGFMFAMCGMFFGWALIDAGRSE